MKHNSWILGPDSLGQCVLVLDGLVAWRGTGLPPATLLPADRKLEQLACEDAVIRDGHVNAHTHLYSGLVPYGVAMPAEQPANFLGILESLWWKLDRALNAELLAISAEVAVADALLCGTTLLVDHHESPNFIAGSLDVIADACEKFGIRACLSYGATERNGGRDEAEAGLMECQRFYNQRGNTQMLSAAFGLHAGFTVSNDTITRAGRMARKVSRPVHVHVAEDLADVQDAIERSFAGPLDRLCRLGGVPFHSVLAHCIHLAPEERARIASHVANAVQNPRSNLGNRVGYPVALQRLSHVALGTDGYIADMDKEVHCAQQQGALHGEPPELALRRLMRSQYMGLGLMDQPGTESLWLRKPADLAAMSASGARHVLVDGRLAVRDGQLPGIDVARLRQRARDAAQKLNQRMAKI